MPEPRAPQRRYCSQACRQAAYESRNGRSKSDERATALVSAWDPDRREALRDLCGLYGWQRLGRREARAAASLMRDTRLRPLWPLDQIGAADIVVFDRPPYPLRRLYLLQLGDDSGSAALAMALRLMWTVLGREPEEHPEGALTALLGSLTGTGQRAVAELLCDSVYGEGWRDTSPPSVV